MSDVRPSVAVIGAGVAGLTAAWLLQRKYHVDLYDGNDYAGGHTRTVVVPNGPDEGTPIDTGFIVMNDRNYPLFRSLLNQLGVETRDSDMSFSYCCERSGYAYAGSNLDTLFAQRWNALRLSHWDMIRDILRFNRTASNDLENGYRGSETLGEYVQRHGFGHAFATRYLYPMGSAIWSSPGEQVEHFPCHAFLHFFRNHGLLQVKNRPQWKYVVGGSHTYVKAMLSDFTGRVQLKRPVHDVTRVANGVVIASADSQIQHYDRAVIATHADQALRLLADPTDQERRALGAWRYQNNEATLHTYRPVMPPASRAWASWNFTQERSASDDQPVSVTYYMNRLQRLRTTQNYFVTLNRARRISQEHVIDQTMFTHPMYTFESVASQDLLPSLNKTGPVYFCGSYFGYGFHEDAVRSAVDVATVLGVPFDESTSSAPSEPDPVGAHA